MDEASDQDIDSAGTEADSDSVKTRKHRAETKGVEKGARPDEDRNPD